MDYSKVYSDFLKSGRKYMCWTGRSVVYDDTYRSQYVFCTDDISLIQVADQIDQPILWARMGIQAGRFLTLEPPFVHDESAMLYLAKNYVHGTPFFLTYKGVITVNPVPVYTPETVEFCIMKAVLSRVGCYEYGISVSQ